MRLLTKYNPSAAAPSTEILETIFSEYEQLRIARTSALVLGARRQGEARVVQGVEACRARDCSAETVSAVSTIPSSEQLPSNSARERVRAVAG